jgi:hypothetical protein
VAAQLRRSSAARWYASRCSKSCSARFFSLRTRASRRRASAAVETASVSARTVGESVTIARSAARTAGSAADAVHWSTRRSSRSDTEPPCRWNPRIECRRAARPPPYARLTNALTPAPHAVSAVAGRHSRRCRDGAEHRWSRMAPPRIIETERRGSGVRNEQPLRVPDRDATTEEGLR